MPQPDDGSGFPIRDAATVILHRQGPGGPEVLMGQRGGNAAFMPSKYVFPGGAVDQTDRDVVLARHPSEETLHRLSIDAGAGLGAALAAAAIRELWEEAGQMLAVPGEWAGTAPAGWSAFAEAGLTPDASALRFIFRAITPPGRTRRFDARFFLLDAGVLHTDPTDFSRASTELSHLHWLPVSETRKLDLPFITEIVLAEVAVLIGDGRGVSGNLPPVPFFDNSGPVPQFRRLG